jgi:hypothetical protein
MSFERDSNVWILIHCLGSFGIGGQLGGCEERGRRGVVVRGRGSPIWFELGYAGTGVVPPFLLRRSAVLIGEGGNRRCNRGSGVSADWRPQPPRGAEAIVITHNRHQPPLPRSATQELIHPRLVSPRLNASCANASPKRKLPSRRRGTKTNIFRSHTTAGPIPASILDTQAGQQDRKQSRSPVTRSVTRPRLPQMDDSTRVSIGCTDRFLSSEET